MQQLSLLGYDANGLTAHVGRRIVYIVSCGDFIKIGFTTRDVQIRLGEMTTGNPLPLVLLGTLLVDSAHDDRDLHNTFAEFHHHNEWFHNTPEFMDILVKMITYHEIAITQWSLDLKKPIVLRHVCPVCHPPADLNEPTYGCVAIITSMKDMAHGRTWPVQVIGDNTPGSILGAANCDWCGAPFVLRVVTWEEMDTRIQERHPSVWWGDPPDPFDGGTSKV